MALAVVLLGPGVASAAPQGGGRGGGAMHGGGMRGGGPSMGGMRGGAGPREDLGGGERWSGPSPRMPGGRWHPGWHGDWRRGDWHHGHWHSRGPRVFFFGSFGPYWYPWYPAYAYPYYPAYPYPVYDEPYAAEDDVEEEAEPPPPPAEDPDRVSYGLVQLVGIADGADVELDGRFWLTARNLDSRWLALPRGEHEIEMLAREGQESVTRRVVIVAGKNHVVKFGPPVEHRT
jgi:hypothetical protein